VFSAKPSSATALRLIVICAGHVIPAYAADQLAPFRFQPLRAHRAIPGRIFLHCSPCFVRRCRGLHNRRSSQSCRGYLLLSVLYHGLPVIAQPAIDGKAQRPTGNGRSVTHSALVPYSSGLRLGPANSFFPVPGPGNGSIISTYQNGFVLLRESMCHGGCHCDYEDLAT
jgi:hypothetical protein